MSKKATCSTKIFKILSCCHYALGNLLPAPASKDCKTAPDMSLALYQSGL